MENPWGSQRRFDRDGDGRLSPSEWTEWYLWTYGHDLEMEDRRKSKTEITLSVSIICHVDLPETWEKMKAALKALIPGREKALRPLLGKALLYVISAAIQYRKLHIEPEKLQELEQFLKETPDLELDAPVSVIAQTIQSHILYSKEAALSEESCGEFWRELISSLTPEQYYGDEPEGLSDLLTALSAADSYFSDTGESECESDQACTCSLDDAFYLHWQENLLLRPDVVRAKQLLAKGEFPDHEDLCRDILITEFPEEMAGCTTEALVDHSWDDILNEVLERDPSKGVRMWRTLLDIASAPLSSDPKTAQQLLQDWRVLDHPTRSTAEAFLTALEDEAFVEQVFQSADAGNLQRDLLTLCRIFDRIELGRHCLELVLKNPYLTGAWDQRLRNALSPDIRSSKPQGSSQSMRISSARDIPDNGTIFHYCTVRIEGVRRTYSYLTGGLPLKAGDWVEVPFGKKDQPRRGQVGSLTDCTRPAAPWPPEQSKTVLRVVEAPVEPIDEVTAAPAIAPEPRIASVQKMEPVMEPETIPEPKAEEDHPQHRTLIHPNQFKGNHLPF